MQARARRRRVWKGIAVVLATLLTATAALSCELPPDLRSDERPGDPALPTEVTASMAVTDLLAVDDENQRIDVDLFIVLGWQDPRLAALAGCRFPVADVWFPRVRLLNSSQLRRAMRNSLNQVAIGEDGKVEYVQRLTGFVSSYHNLADFPFDSHVFRIDMGAEREGDQQIAFIADNDNTWISDRLNVEGWHIKGVTLAVQPFFWREDSLNFSVLSLQIEAQRNPEFYIYRVLLLLVLVVGMSWVIFWVPPRQYEFQIGIGATSMLTVIAFNLAISNALPPVGYLTVLDKMVTWAIILVLMAIIEAVVTGRLVMAGDEERALRMDRIARYAFPALLFGGWALIYLI